MFVLSGGDSQCIMIFFFSFLFGRMISKIYIQICLSFCAGSTNFLFQWKGQNDCKVTSSRNRKGQKTSHIYHVIYMNSQTVLALINPLDRKKLQLRSINLTLHMYNTNLVNLP